MTPARRPLALLLAATVLAACTSGGADTRGGISTPPTTSSSPASTSVAPTTSAATTPPSTTSPAPTTSAPRSTPTSTGSSTVPPLPNGGTTIFPGNRVVAYYGGPDGPRLGVLGNGSPDQAADAITARAASYRRFGRPVQPAMELIATVAQGSAGPDGNYSRAIGDDQIESYLAAAHRHRMLLLLDIQPGGGDFLPQVQHLRRFLLDPWVSLALDPEWKVPHGSGPPGNGRIGSASAASINAVGSWLSDLVTDHHLPDKLLVIHQFTRSMLPDRQNIQRFRGLEEVLHADGESSPSGKRAVYHQLAFPVPPFHAGFKLFFTQDTRLMSPDEVMALRPQPEMITYQ